MPEPDVLSYIETQVRRSLNFEPGTVKHGILTAIFTMNNGSFTNHDIVSRTLKLNGSANESSINTEIHNLIRKKQLSEFIEHEKRRVFENGTTRNRWVHRFKPEVLEEARKHIHSIHREIEELNQTKKPVTKNTGKILLVGGHPNEHPKLQKYASKMKLELRIISTNCRGIGSPDLIIICKSHMSHKLEEQVISLNKKDIPILYMCNCNKREFKKIVRAFIPALKNNDLESLIKQFNVVGLPKNNLIEETQSCETIEASDTMEDTTSLVKVISRPEPKEEIKEEPSEDVLEESTQEESSKEEPSDTEDVKPECHVQYILKECKRELQSAIDKANSTLSDLDISTGKIDVEYKDGDFKVTICFTT